MTPILPIKRNKSDGVVCSVLSACHVVTVLLYSVFHSQQDAQEFLRYLLQGLHEDVNRVKSKPKYIGADDEKEDKMS